MFMMILEQHWHVYDDMTMSAFFHHVVLKTVFFFIACLNQNRRSPLLHTLYSFGS